MTHNMVVAALEQGMIDGVEVPSLLPSRALLPLLLLHKQGVTDGAKVPLSSTREQGTANNAKAPHHHCRSGGQLTVPRCYCTGRRQCQRCAREG
jgi:hypothetical protein